MLSQQSVSPSQSLSTPSAQLVSVDGTGNTPLQAQFTPEHLSRELLDEQVDPAQSVSAQSVFVSLSLSRPSLQLLSGVTQVPETQVLPKAQTELTPHLQTPAVQESARVMLQVVQVLAGTPHAEVAVPGAQVFPLQQPLVQLVESHTQVPPVAQRWPAAQAALVPQRQEPVAEQLSAAIPHARQAAPLVWQAASVGGLTQLPPLQHPLAQLVASHTQVPLLQWFPIAHSAFEPQRQVPAASHPLARIGSHALQAAPPVPQSAAVGAATQVEPLQQPLAQFEALQPAHTWAVQLWPPQDAQTAPFLPHSVLSVPALHCPVPSQQPPEQLVESQTQLPPTQRCPAAQAAPAPHAQAPVVQRSDFASQAAQPVPAAPQAVIVWLAGAMQVEPLQQPLGHEAAVQTHAPPVQTWPL